MADQLIIPHNLDEVIRKLDALSARLNKVQKSYNGLYSTVNRFNKSSNTFDRQINKQVRGLDRASRAATRYAKSLNSVGAGGAGGLVVGGGGRGRGSSVGGVMGISGGLWARFAALGLGRMAWQAGKSSVNTYADIDAMRTAMNFAVGGEAMGGKFFKGGRKTADTLGIAFQPAIEGLTKIQAAMRGTGMNKNDAKYLFEGISKAVVTLGLDSEKAHGTFMAFEQIISKGKVSAEELRRQLGDRIPGAFQIAARAMGVTTSKLDDMLKKGELLSEDFIPKMARQLNEEFAEGWAKASERSRAELNRLSNSVLDFNTALGEKLVPTISLADEIVKDSTRFINGLASAWTMASQAIKDYNDEAIKQKPNQERGIYGDVVEYIRTYNSAKEAAKQVEANRRDYKSTLDNYGQVDRRIQLFTHKWEKWNADGTLDDIERNAALDMISKDLPFAQEHRNKLRSGKNYLTMIGKGDEVERQGLGTWGAILAYQDALNKMGVDENLDPLTTNKNGGGLTDEAGEMAKVLGGGNRILNVKIGNIIEKNEANFVQGNEQQQEEEAGKMTEAITRALISTLQDLGQIVP